MVRVLIPSGALGLGYDRDALARGVACKPDIIAIDVAPLTADHTTWALVHQSIHDSRRNRSGAN